MGISTVSNYEVDIITCVIIWQFFIQKNNETGVRTDLLNISFSSYAISCASEIISNVAERKQLDQDCNADEKFRK